ncbi:MAG: hypothetical protein ACJ74G_15025 [Blastocatellia bacterium]
MYLIPPFRHRSLIVLALLLAAIALTGCMRRYVSVEDIDKMIQEQVPVGSDKQQVKAFIDNLKVGSLEIYRDKEFHRATPDALGNSDPEKVAALGDRIAEFTGCYISETESDGFITSNGIGITFYIDKDGHMIDYTINQ